MHVDQIQVPCIERWILNYWAIREVSLDLFIFYLLTCLLLLFGCTGSSPRHSGLSLVAESGGCSLVAEHALLTVASPVAEPGFQVCALQQSHHVGSAAVVHLLSRSAARRVSLDQGLNPYLLHWAGGFLSTGPPGKSSVDF